MSSDHDHPIRTHCQNCEAELKGRYCSACGQKDFDFHQSFGHVVHEALETWFHVDGSFFRGFYNLLFRPGVMTKEFNDGKRARHVPPLRFYLVVSVLFFLLIPPHDAANGAIVLDDQDRAELLENGISANGSASRSEPGTTERMIEDRVGQFIQDPGLFWNAFLRALPKTLLACLPIFALITRLLYRRGGLRYLQHLILSVHLHTFVFLWWMVAYGWVKLIGLWSESLADLSGLAATAYIFYYFYATLRRVFGGSRLRIFVKGTFAGACYTFALTFAMGATAVIAGLLA
ncbi:MAG TPA: DUF3667 domain-containing protein [Opitutaceae bacterium]